MRVLLLIIGYTRPFAFRLKKSRLKKWIPSRLGWRFKAWFQFISRG